MKRRTTPRATDRHVHPESGAEERRPKLKREKTANNETSKVVGQLDKFQTVRTLAKRGPAAPGERHLPAMSSGLQFLGSKDWTCTSSAHQFK